MTVTNEVLVDRIQRGCDRDESLAELYRNNTGILQKVAAEFSWSGEDMEDLMQSAWIGLQKSVDKYDPEVGVTFLSYALYWVRRELRRYAESCGHLVRLPEFRQDQILRYNKFVNEYQLTHGRKPSKAVICQELEISEQVLRNIRKAIRIQDLDSLDKPIPGTEDVTLGDTVKGTQNVEEDACDNFLTEQLKSQLWAILDGLKANQKAAVVGTVMDCRTLADVGQELGVGSQRVAQLRNEAIRNIKRSRAFRQLKRDYDDLYGMGLRGTGLSTFKITDTSSTEAAALRLIEKENSVRSLIELLDIRCWIIKEQFKQSAGATGIIRKLVSDPELQDVLIRVCTKSVNSITDPELSKYRIQIEQLHNSLSESKNNAPDD